MFVLKLHWLFKVNLVAVSLLICGFTSSVYAFDKPVPWQTLTDSTVGRTEVAAARVGEAAYIVGGFSETDGRVTTIVERYDLKRDRWRRVSPIPVGVHHAAAVSYHNDLYVIGGYTAVESLDKETNALWRYLSKQDRWEKLRSAPMAVAAHAAGVIGSKLYVAGGASARKAQAKLQIYDFKRKRWSFGSSMSTAREHLAGTVTGGAFYVLAGRTSTDGNFAVAERYLPKQDRWQQLPAMEKPRGGIAAVTVNGWVMAVGGEEDAATIREVEGYDRYEERWLRFQDLPTPRHGLAAVAYHNKIYVIEGGVTPGLSYSRKVEVLKVPPAR